MGSRFGQEEANLERVCVWAYRAVKTDLTKESWDNFPPEQLFEPEFVAGKLVDVVMDLRHADRGQFWDFKGERLDW